MTFGAFVFPLSLPLPLDVELPFWFPFRASNAFTLGFTFSRFTRAPMFIGVARSLPCVSNVEPRAMKFLHRPLQVVVARDATRDEAQELPH
eukprot:3043363-Heterocapsa_arctica.AAC.1